MRSEIQALKHFYQHYQSADLGRLSEFYSDGVVFEDPLHSIHGLDALTRYFGAMQKGVSRCEFEFGAEYGGEHHVVLEWQMLFEHRVLAYGAPIRVAGCSLLLWSAEEAKIHRHRDYFDLGQMLYEHTPLLGGLVRKLKSSVAGKTHA